MITIIEHRSFKGNINDFVYKALYNQSTAILSKVKLYFVWYIPLEFAVISLVSRTKCEVFIKVLMDWCDWPILQQKWNRMIQCISRRFGLSTFWFVGVLIVDILVCRRFDQLPTSNTTKHSMISNATPQCNISDFQLTYELAVKAMCVSFVFYQKLNPLFIALSITTDIEPHSRWFRRVSYDTKQMWFNQDCIRSTYDFIGSVG